MAPRGLSNFANVFCWVAECLEAIKHDLSHNALLPHFFCKLG